MYENHSWRMYIIMGYKIDHIYSVLLQFENWRTQHVLGKCTELYYIVYRYVVNDIETKIFSYSCLLYFQFSFSAHLKENYKITKLHYKVKIFVINMNLHQNIIMLISSTLNSLKDVQYRILSMTRNQYGLLP